MKEIPLTQGLFALVDDEDYEELIKFKWCANKIRKAFYVVRDSRDGNKKTRVYMHRMILKTPRGFDTDHIDGNGLNNQKSNLRVVSHRKNLQNRHEKKTSRYPGVSWDKKQNKWKGTIYVRRGIKHLGYFHSEEEAHRKYVIACNEIENKTGVIITLSNYKNENL